MARHSIFKEGNTYDCDDADTSTTDLQNEYDLCQNPSRLLYQRDKLILASMAQLECCPVTER